MSHAKEGPAGSWRVGVFAKRPRAGEVKTRLAPVLGLERAADFARALLDDAVARLCHEQAHFGGELVFAPAGERPWFEAAYPGAALRAQVGAGLAERMAAWFDEVLGSGVLKGAIAVGSDAPWIGAARVGEAIAKLEAGADVVLGPDRGGGYYLVGMARPVPGLFTEIEMSTASMFTETCALVQRRGLRLELLEADDDVDDAGDWTRLLADLEHGREGQLDRVAAFVGAWRRES